MNLTKSQQLFEEAKKYIPGGVNSPVRAFGSVGMSPVFVDRAEGARIIDVDGNEYIDFICSWGPLILGHSNKEIMEGFQEIAERGTSYGLPTAIEIEMAKLIVETYKSVDMVRMVNSGTEATMSALRVARGYTNRRKILKFEGCYHGHSDSLLVKSGSGTLTFGVPTSPGVPEDIVKHTVVCRYNDIESVKEMFKACGEDIAAVIIEPIPGNMGVVAPDLEFLKELRKITEENGTVLIYDEVITGFRVGVEGAQGLYGIEPDMTCFGKIIGAGLPVGAYGGKREIMEVISPIGPVYQAGTLSGNPLAMYMGLKNLRKLIDNPSIYETLNNKAIKLEVGLKAVIEELGIEASVNRVEGMVCLFMAKGPINTYEDVMKSDTGKYAIYFKEMLNQGILLPPAQFEGLFLSTAHTDEDIDTMVDAAKAALKVAYNV